MRAPTVHFCLNKGNTPRETGRSTMLLESGSDCPQRAGCTETRGEFAGRLVAGGDALYLLWVLSHWCVFRL